MTGSASARPQRAKRVRVAEGCERKNKLDEENDASSKSAQSKPLFDEFHNMPHHSARSRTEQHSITYRKINSQNVTEGKNRLSLRRSEARARLVSQLCGPVCVSDNKTLTAPFALHNIYFCLRSVSTTTMMMERREKRKKIKFWHVSLIYQSQSNVMLIFNANFVSFFLDAMAMGVGETRNDESEVRCYLRSLKFR